MLASRHNNDDDVCLSVDIFARPINILILQTFYRRDTTQERKTKTIINIIYTLNIRA